MKLLDIAYVNLVFLVLDRVEDLHASLEQKNANCSTAICEWTSEALRWLD